MLAQLLTAALAAGLALGSGLETAAAVAAEAPALQPAVLAGCKGSVCAATPSQGLEAPSDRIYVQRLSTAVPNAVYPEACNSTVTFNDPGSWSHGNASLTVALVRLHCAGVSRQLHWHHDADEWGYVVSGEVYTYIASPDGLPWPASTNHLKRHGVWYFPRGWLHGFTCVTPENGPCEVILTFNTPASVPIDNHNLDTTLAQAPDPIAAQALGLESASYRKSARPRFAESAAATALSSPLLVHTPGLCEPRCPAIVETTAMPAVANLLTDGRPVVLPGGARAHDMRTPQFPFAKTLSQELLLLEPGVFRGANWVTNANALLVVTEGVVEVQLQGGVTDATTHDAFGAVLRAGDAFFVPIARNYVVREATGRHPAMAVVTFDTGEWQTAELGPNLRELPPWAVSASLRGASMGDESERLTALADGLLGDDAVGGAAGSAWLALPIFLAALGAAAAGLMWVLLSLSGEQKGAGSSADSGRGRAPLLGF